MNLKVGLKNRSQTPSRYSVLYLFDHVHTLITEIEEEIEEYWSSISYINNLILGRIFLKLLII